VGERALPRPLAEQLEPLFCALEEAAEGDADALGQYKGNSVYMWRLQRQMPRHNYEHFMAPYVGGWGGGRVPRCAALMCVGAPAGIGAGGKMKAAASLRLSGDCFRGDAWMLLQAPLVFAPAAWS
jgi:hypothetical protein